MNAYTIRQYELDVEKYHMQHFSLRRDDVVAVTDDEILSAVDIIIEQAKCHSEIVTPDLFDLQEDGLSYLVDLDERLKKRSRIISKIQQKKVVDKKTTSEAIQSIKDSLRYTIVITNDDMYVEKVDEYLKEIEKLGYSVVRFTNRWGGEHYQGIHVTLATSDDFLFELQFHTAFGHTIKEGKLRLVYDIIRDPNSPPELTRKCNEIRKYYQKLIPVPANAIGYTFGGRSV